MSQRLQKSRRALLHSNLARASTKLKDGVILENLLPGLDIGLPYLAGTYDERMYDRIRSRAQTFEILTGGDPNLEREQQNFWLDPDDFGNQGNGQYVPLPINMLEQLRVNLAVDLDSNEL